MDIKAQISTKIQQAINNSDLSHEQIYEKLKKTHLKIYNEFNKKQLAVHRELTLQKANRRKKNIHLCMEQLQQEMYDYRDKLHALKKKYGPYFEVYEGFMKNYDTFAEKHGVAQA
jgi:predicted GIY-YIG superfamily endonuclease